MGCLDLCVCVRSDAITDRGRAEKNAQCIGCQLLEGKAREASICCQLLSTTTKGGSSTEGCGTVYRSRIARNLYRDVFTSSITPRRNRNSFVFRNSNDISPFKRRSCETFRRIVSSDRLARVQSYTALEMGGEE